MQLGNNIYNLRKDKGLSQEKLAEKSHAYNLATSCLTNVLYDDILPTNSKQKGFDEE